MAEYKYDVAVSFAGEQREYVERVVRRLQEHGVRVFYDADNQVEFWGQSLVETLDRVYRVESRNVVIFVSKEYVAKPWTNHERRSALTKRVLNNDNSVWPARFDDVELPGLQPDTGYIPLEHETPDSLAEKIMQKLGIDIQVSQEVAAAMSQAPTTGGTMNQSPVGHIIIGITDPTMHSMLEIMGDSSEATSASQAQYQEIVLESFTELQSTIGVIVHAKEVSEDPANHAEGKDREILFLETIGDEVISRATSLMFPEVDAIPEPVQSFPGLDYMVVGVREDIAELVRLLRLEQLKPGSRTIQREPSREIFFEDMDSVYGAVAAFGKARANSKNDGELFRSLAREVARNKMRRAIRKS